MYTPKSSMVMDCKVGVGHQIAIVSAAQMTTRNHTLHGLPSCKNISSTASTMLVFATVAAVIFVGAAAISSGRSGGGSGTQADRLGRRADQPSYIGSGTVLLLLTLTGESGCKYVTKGSRINGCVHIKRIIVPPVFCDETFYSNCSANDTTMFCSINPQ